MGGWFGANEEALQTLQEHALHLAANEAAEEAPPTGYASLTPPLSLSRARARSLSLSLCLRVLVVVRQADMQAAI